MLASDVSLMGIAVAIQPGGKYHNYWSLDLGTRYVPPAGGPGPGPGPGPGTVVTIGGAVVGR